MTVPLLSMPRMIDAERDSIINIASVLGPVASIPTPNASYRLRIDRRQDRTPDVTVRVLGSELVPSPGSAHS
jgi:hypothetical protein